MEDLHHLHHWDVLALSCIDGRFTQRVAHWLGEKAGRVYDFRTEVGCTKALIDSVEDRERFFNVIDVAKRLHSIKEVWLIDHVDCGAYGGSKEHADISCEKQFHADKLTEAAKIVGEKYPDLAIKKIFAGWSTIEEI